MFQFARSQASLPISATYCCAVLNLCSTVCARGKKQLSVDSMTADEIKEQFLDESGDALISRAVMDKMRRNKKHPYVKGCDQCGSKKACHYGRKRQDNAEPGTVLWECIDCLVDVFMEQRKKGFPDIPEGGIPAPQPPPPPPPPPQSNKTDLLDAFGALGDPGLSLSPARALSVSPSPFPSPSIPLRLCVILPPSPLSVLRSFDPLSLVSCCVLSATYYAASSCDTLSCVCVRSS